MTTSTAPDGTVYLIPSEAEQQVQFEEFAQITQFHREQGKKIVLVQGLGFVGSAVAAVVASARDAQGQPLYFVIGVDLPIPSAYWKVGHLNKGLIPITSPDPELPTLTEKAVLGTKNLQATVSQQAYSLADVIVVDIHLDVKNRLSATKVDVDLDSFGAGIRAIGRSMRPDALVLNVARNGEVTILAASDVAARGVGGDPTGVGIRGAQTFDEPRGGRDRGTGKDVRPGKRWIRADGQGVVGIDGVGGEQIPVGVQAHARPLFLPALG